MKKIKFVIIGFSTLIMLLILILGIFITVSLFFGRSVDTGSLTSDFDDFYYAYENDSISRDIIDGLLLDDITLKISEDGSTYTLDFEITNLSEDEVILEIQVYASEAYNELYDNNTALLTTKTVQEDIALQEGEDYNMSRTSLILCDEDELKSAFSYVYVEIICDPWHCRIMVPVTVY